MWASTISQPSCYGARLPQVGAVFKKIQPRLAIVRQAARTPSEIVCLSSIGRGPIYQYLLVMAGLETMMSCPPSCIAPYQQQAKDGRSAGKNFGMFHFGVDGCSHLDVNDYSIVPIITAIRTTFPVGPLAIAKVDGLRFAMTRLDIDLNFHIST